MMAIKKEVHYFLTFANFLFPLLHYIIFYCNRAPEVCSISKEAGPIGLLESKIYSLTISYRNRIKTYNKKISRQHRQAPIGVFLADRVMGGRGERYRGLLRVHRTQSGSASRCHIGPRQRTRFQFVPATHGHIYGESPLPPSLRGLHPSLPLTARRRPSFKRS